MPGIWGHVHHIMFHDHEDATGALSIRPMVSMRSLLFATPCALLLQRLGFLLRQLLVDLGALAGLVTLVRSLGIVNGIQDMCPV